MKLRRNNAGHSLVFHGSLHLNKWFSNSNRLIEQTLSQPLQNEAKQLETKQSEVSETSIGGQKVTH